jgi:para-nitrobenzyl esterase
MDRDQGDPVVAAPCGTLRGRWHDGGVAEFRGVPYAAPPVGRLRFQPPEPASLWPGELDASISGPACPQLPGRGDAVMGPTAVSGYDEDCLRVDVWTPAPTADASLPVLVWFHGGGFLFGAGSARFYDGAVMARRGGIVVVNVTYRLGAFGYLYLPGAAGRAPVANVGLQDQCAALEWVRDNVAAFGGNPATVTVAGQSAGGLSIVGLAAMPRAHGLFHRAILQSSGPGVEAQTTEEAERRSAMFFRHAGLEVNDLDGLQQLPTEKVNEAQGALLLELVLAAGHDPRISPGKLAMPFQLVTDGEVLPREPSKAALEQGSLDDVDLLVMCTSEEMRFALAADEAFWALDRDEILGQLEAAGDPHRIELFEQYLDLNPGERPAALLADLIGDEMCLIPTIRLAERRARLRTPGFFAWFTWQSPADGGRLGACHTLELPFVFNNFECWADAPALAGVSEAELRRLGDAVQDDWTAFVRTGEPATEWPAYELPDRKALEFGASIGVVEDPIADRRQLWEKGAPE